MTKIVIYATIDERPTTKGAYVFFPTCERGKRALRTNDTVLFILDETKGREMCNELWDNDEIDVLTEDDMPYDATFFLAQGYAHELQRKSLLKRFTDYITPMIDQAFDQKDVGRIIELMELFPTFAIVEKSFVMDRLRNKLGYRP